MAEERSVDIIDYLLIILKWKKTLIALAIVSFLISYGMVYFFVDEQYDSTSLVLPTGAESGLSNSSGILKNLKELPMGLGGSTKSSETDLYMTIVNSRTMLENVVKKFDLMKDYHTQYINDAVKEAASKIKASVTEEKAFQLSVRANSKVKAHDINAYIISELNKKVIALNLMKATNSREFLEQRCNDMRKDLKNAEDSLQRFQEKSGMFEADDQIKLILDTYSKFESVVMSKKLEYEIMAKLKTSDDPLLLTKKEEVLQSEAQLENLKNNGKKESAFLSFNSLPKKAKDFVRYYRDVKVYQSILEFLLPMYEQAKFDEQKSTPVVQVIDAPSWPEKKAYPLRGLTAAVSTIIVICISMLLIFVGTILSGNSNPKIKLLTKNLSFKKSI